MRVANVVAQGGNSTSSGITVPLNAAFVFPGDEVCSATIIATNATAVF